MRHLALTLCIGCSYAPDRSAQLVDDANTGTDGDVPVCETWNPQHFDACQISPPGPCLDLDSAGTYVYDTDARRLVDPAGVEVPHTSDDGVAVIVSTECVRVRSGVTLRAIGARPLIVAAWTRIRIEGVVDVASSAAGAGAGANPAACTPAARGEDDPGGAGGGGGGGFGAAGGKGGDGDSNENAGNDGIAIGGAGGPAIAVETVTPRGGCPGADGGEGTPGIHGTGGAGGGAIQLSARDEIEVTGTITAGGQGGIGRTTDAGGGGGGSGGYIGLDAPLVDLGGATLAANGGAGSGGGDDGNLGVAGGDGGATTTAALGGTGGAPGGTRGGDGGALASAPGATVLDFNTGAGGGGGGGVGFVLVWATTLDDANAVVSPPVIRR